MTQDEDLQLKKWIEEQLKMGYNRPSKSPYASSFFFIKKKDGKLRPVQDYRRINACTIRNQYPLPLMSELINDLGNAHIYTKLDVRWGYNNIHIKEGNEWKASFVMPLGLFEPTVMFFGLTNSPTTFQVMMNMIFQDLIITKKIMVYMDDILIFSKSMAKHILIINQVLQILRNNDLYLKPEKCEFYKDKLNYLVFTI